MNFFAILATTEVFVETGLALSILAMGYYITYHILDFPDLTVEGTFLTGAVVYGALVNFSINPWIGLCLAFLAGSLFGALSGILHVKLHIRPLLCGILVSTALITINLVATSTSVNAALNKALDFKGELYSTINFGRDSATLHNSFPANLLPAKLAQVINFRDLILFLVIAILFKLLLDFFLKTKCGLLLRATGGNPVFVTSLAKDAGNSKILGLAIGNGCAAVSGVLFATASGNVNQSMGVGIIVMGLASLIIGLSVFRKVHFMKPTTKVIWGAIIYEACLVLASKMGIPSAYNKLIMAVLFTIALVLSSHKEKIHSAATPATPPTPMADTESTDDTVLKGDPT